MTLIILHFFRSHAEHKFRNGAKIFGIGSVDHGAESKIKLLRSDDNGLKNPGPDSIVYLRIMSFESIVTYGKFTYFKTQQNVIVITYIMK